MNTFWNETSAIPSTVLQAFAAGLLVGTGITLLFAPKTGAEMRREIARRLSFDRNEEFADKVREHGGLPGPFKHLAP
jgi:hypothetical protein